MHSIYETAAHCLEITSIQLQAYNIKGHLSALLRLYIHSRLKAQYAVFQVDRGQYVIFLWMKWRVLFLFGTTLFSWPLCRSSPMARLIYWTPVILLRIMVIVRRTKKKADLDWYALYVLHDRLRNRQQTGVYMCLQRFWRACRLQKESWGRR